MKRGFTLVELMTAISIFIIVMTISMSSIIGAFDANRRARSLKTVVSNLNLAVESMSKEMRFGRNYHCGSTGTLTTPENCSDGDNYLSFLSSDGVQTAYRLNAGAVEKKIGSAGFSPITAPEITIDDLTFYVLGAGGNNTHQPKVIMKLQSHAGTAKARTDFDLQTLISQRSLDFSSPAAYAYQTPAYVTPPPPVPTITYVGPVSGTYVIGTVTPLYLTTPGTYTITINITSSITIKGIAGGGGGGGGTSDNATAQTGAGGGGGASSLAGIGLSLDQNKTYTAVVGGGGIGGGPGRQNNGWVGDNGGTGGITSFAMSSAPGTNYLSLNGGNGGSGAYRSGAGGAGGTVGSGGGNNGSKGGDSVGRTTSGNNGSNSIGAAGGASGGGADNDGIAGRGGGNGGNSGQQNGKSGGAGGVGQGQPGQASSFGGYSNIYPDQNGSVYCATVGGGGGEGGGLNPGNGSYFGGGGGGGAAGASCGTFPNGSNGPGFFGGSGRGGVLVFQ